MKPLLIRKEGRWIEADYSDLKEGDFYKYEESECPSNIYRCVIAPVRDADSPIGWTTGSEVVERRTY